MLMRFPGRRESYYDRWNPVMSAGVGCTDLRRVSSVSQTSIRRCYNSKAWPLASQSFGHLLNILSQSMGGEGPEILPLMAM